jgi:hypothetical protein
MIPGTRVSQGEHFSLRLRVSCNRAPLSVVYIALLDYQVLYPVLTNYRIVICVYIPYCMHMIPIIPYSELQY